MMAKNAKKSRAKQMPKASKGAARKAPARDFRDAAPETGNRMPTPCDETPGGGNCAAPHVLLPNCAAAPTMRLHTRAGVLDEEIYGQIIEPAFQAFALRDDETALRMLAESAVSAITTREDYAKFRKLDDICQRYLYYAESFGEITRRTRERVEVQGLLTYWRSQMCMAFVCDSRAMRDLLLPPDRAPKSDEQIAETQSGAQSGAEMLQNRGGANPAAGFDMFQSRFLRGIDTVLNPSMGAGICADRTAASCRDLYDFAHGMSFPWIGFDPDRVFNLKHIVFDEALCVSHCFSHLDAGYVRSLKDDLAGSLEEALFIDLLYAQHRKLYDEIHAAFGDGDRLPPGFLSQLRLRVRFDKVYRAAYDDILSGRRIMRPLHRASRLDIDDLNAFGAFAGVWHQAALTHSGLYAFHYFG